MSTLTTIAANTQTLSGTVAVGDLVVFTCYMTVTDWTSYVELTGLTVLSKISAGSFQLGLLKATQTNISLKNNGAGAGGLLAKLS